MPWIMDGDNEKCIASRYDKSELPVYGELIDNWVFSYNKENDDQQKDLYWNLPLKLVLLGKECNFLNKMLYEEHPRDLYKHLNNNICTHIRMEDDLYFTLRTENCNKFIPWKTGIIPPIYTFNYPDKDVVKIHEERQGVQEINMVSGELERALQYKTLMFTVRFKNKNINIDYDQLCAHVMNYLADNSFRRYNKTITLKNDSQDEIQRCDGFWLQK